MMQQGQEWELYNYRGPFSLEVVEASVQVEMLRRKWNIAAADVEYYRSTEGPKLEAEIRADKAMLAFYRAANMLAVLISNEIESHRAICQKLEAARANGQLDL